MTHDELADHLGISQLMSRYYQVVDALDFAGWAACFADGGRFEGAYDSYDAHADLAKFEHDARELEQKWTALRHQATAPVIVLNGDRATAESNFCMTTVKAGKDGQPQVDLVMAGRYADELERTAVGWRFRTRRSLPDRPADRTTRLA